MKVRSALCSTVGSFTLVALLATTGCGFSRNDIPSTAEGGRHETQTAQVPAPPNEKLKPVPLRKYGISYSVPRAWKLLDGAKLLNPDNPAMKEFADKVGQSPERLAEMMKNAIDTYAVSNEPPTNGFTANVNSTGAVTSDAPSDEQLRLEVGGFGGHVIGITHPSTPLGTISRTSYTLEVRGITIHAVFLGIRSGKGFVGITVSNYTQHGVEARATEIQRSLKKL